MKVPEKPTLHFMQTPVETFNEIYDYFQLVDEYIRNLSDAHPKRKEMLTDIIE